METTASTEKVATLPAATDQPEIINVEISDDPRHFDIKAVRAAIRQIVVLINEGRSPDEFVCECSRFPLIEQVRMAMNGELIAGVFSSNPDFIADALARHIKKQILDQWQSCLRFS